MKKSFLMLSLCLLSFLSHAISDETLLKYGPRAGKVTGGVIGGIAGGVAGAATGYGIGGATIKESPEDQEKQAHQKMMQKTLGVVGGAALMPFGAQAGAMAGEALANKRLVTHFSKKYNISPRLAQAFVQAKISPANAEIREIFEAALHRDTDKIKDFLTTRYSKKFGPDWNKIIFLDTIPTFLTISQINTEIKIKKETTFKGFYGFAGKEINALQKKIEALKAKNPNYTEYIATLLPDANLLGAISDLYIKPTVMEIFMNSLEKQRIFGSQAKNLAKFPLLIISLSRNNN